MIRAAKYTYSILLVLYLFWMVKLLLVAMWTF